jgi:hypothetical protein
MNVTTIKVITTTAIVAVFGAAGMIFIRAESTPAPQIVKLDRVVVYGKHAQAQAQSTQVAQIVQLPRVVVHGHRADPDASAQLAQAGKDCKADTQC